MEIRPARLTPEILELLATCALPTDDLGDPAIALFAASEGTTLAGVIGLQQLDGVGLLRSLAVVPSARSLGLGGRLCDHVLAEARARGLVEVWLLTTSARDFFARRSFTAVARAAAPPGVQTCAQFTSLCPGTATVMRTSL